MKEQRKINQVDIRCFFDEESLCGVQARCAACKGCRMGRSDKVSL